jgi:hypothetical protein
VLVYKESFPVGTTVEIASRAELDEFRRTWRFHHPLTEEQGTCAGRVVRVASVGFYHGGDVLYTLEGVPGIWYQRCLRLADAPAV